MLLKWQMRKLTFEKPVFDPKYSEKPNRKVSEKKHRLIAVRRGKRGKGNKKEAPLPDASCVSNVKDSSFS